VTPSLVPDQAPGTAGDERADHGADLPDGET
jgi:hypothetical protein